jgi:protoporphyrinogen oxidase
MNRWARLSAAGSDGKAYENLIEPLMSGIYAGDGDQLSLASTFSLLTRSRAQIWQPGTGRPPTQEAIETAKLCKARALLF